DPTSQQIGQYSQHHLARRRLTPCEHGRCGKELLRLPASAHKDAALPDLGLRKQALRTGKAQVFEPKKPAVLEIRCRDAPAALQVPVQVILDHLAKCVVRCGAGRPANVRVCRVVLEPQRQRFKYAPRELTVGNALSSSGMSLL